MSLRLVIVAGKGGVGKTTVSAALARAAAAAGRSVLVVDTEGQRGLPSSFGIDRLTYEEQLVWEGLPWRWCLRYTKPNDPTRAFAFLVPNPEKPRLGIPFTGEMLQGMPLHRLKKYMKETIVASHDVGGMFWTEFEFASKSQLDDAMDLAKRKNNYITAKS